MTEVWLSANMFSAQSRCLFLVPAAITQRNTLTLEKQYAQLSRVKSVLNEMEKELNVVWRDEDI